MRVRYHKDDMARIEVPPDDLPHLLNLELRSELIPALSAFGFKFITVDLAGFRSGSLNSVAYERKISFAESSERTIRRAHG